jgi:hypothetical protein
VLGLGELININFKPNFILCGLNLEVELFVFKWFCLILWLLAQVGAELDCAMKSVYAPLV